MLTLDIAKTVLKFMAERAQARTDYLETRRSLEAMAGSRYHDTAMRAATEKREKAITAAQALARSEAQAIIAKMRENAATIRTNPPTPEMLAILQALEMRDALKADELAEAAAAMGGNSLALAALDTLARKNGQYSNFAETMSEKLSRAAAEKMINDLEKEVWKTISDTVGAKEPAREYARYQAMTQGREIDLDDLPQMPEYADEFDLLAALGVSDFDKFAAAVDKGACSGNE